MPPSSPDSPAVPAASAVWTGPLELDPESVAATPRPAASESTAIPTSPPRLPALLPVPLPSGRGWGAAGLLLAALLALMLVGAGFDLADLLQRAFATSATLGLGVSGLAALVLLSAGRLAVLELRGLRGLRRTESLRAAATGLLAARSHAQSGPLVREIALLCPPLPESAAATVPLPDLLRAAADDGDVLRLVERHLLAPRDRLARQMIARAARQTALAAALSPAALLDVVVVLSRNLALIRELAHLYGSRPGAAGTLRLLRQMLAHLAVAGLTESAHHATVEALGGGIAAAVSARAGQAAVNGLLTARIGLAAVAVSRPLPFVDQPPPSLASLQTEILTSARPAAVES